MHPFLIAYRIHFSLLTRTFIIHRQHIKPPNQKSIKSKAVDNRSPYFTSSNPIIDPCRKMRFISLAAFSLAALTAASPVAVFNNPINVASSLPPSIHKIQGQGQGHVAPAVALEENGSDDHKRRPPRVNVTTWFESYHRSDEIRQYFLQLAEDYHDLVTFVPQLARTHEGREVYAVKISAKGRGSRDKPQVWIQALQHAREWATGKKNSPPKKEHWIDANWKYGGVLD